MGLASSTRAETIAYFWKTSKAWYNHNGEAEGWTFEDMINALRTLIRIQGPVAMQAQELLDRVVEDKATRDPCEAKLYAFPTIHPITFQLYEALA